MVKVAYVNGWKPAHIRLAQAPAAPAPSAPPATSGRNIPVLLGVGAVVGAAVGVGISFLFPSDRSKVTTPKLLRSAGVGAAVGAAGAASNLLTG
ncbi:MAG TPA: hypothetical protein VEN81_09785 [Planctomycetota bacterium]|nr:hypothetical protein [Planctomycetota bacterium]